MTPALTGDQMYDLAFPVIWYNENGSTSPELIAVSDNPSDPGGYTRGGIALNEQPQITRAELDAMTYQDFYNWYKNNIWLPAKCYILPWPLALIVFDGEVNQGSEGVKAMQEALGVDADGVIGPITQSALVRCLSVLELTAMTLTIRDEIYRANAGFATFGRGWLKRLYSTALMSAEGESQTSTSTI